MKDSNIIGQPLQTTSGDSNINFREQLFTYLRHWPWFLLSLFLFIAIAFVYIRYTVPQYFVQTTILVNQGQTEGGSELAAFKDLGYFDDSQSKIENEIQILKSRTLMMDVAKQLSLNVEYYTEGTVLEFENYPKSFVEINFLAPDSLIYNKYKIFNLRVDSKSGFTLLDSSGEGGKQYSFGNSISTSLGDVIITPSTNQVEDFIDEEIKIVVQPIRTVAEYYRGKIDITPVGESSSVLAISLNDPVESKARDIVNTLVSEYNRTAIENNRQVAERTAEFINERIALITTDLSAVDTEAAEFKSERGLGTDVGAQAQRMAEGSLQTNREISTLNTQIKLIRSMRDYVQSQGNQYETLPVNLGFADQAITTIVGRFNELVLRRNSLLESATLQNTAIINLDQQLDGLRQSLISSLNSVEQSTKIQLGSLQSQEEYFSGRLYSSPKQQQTIEEIERQSIVQEQLYLYLLQKREEAKISSEVSPANARVIDQAITTNQGSVTPASRIVYSGAVFLGLLFPFVIIYVSNLLDVKVNTKQDLERALTTPIIGDIPKTKDNMKLVVSQASNSPVVESFRILRTNIDFLMANIATGNSKVIFATSTLSGEGKTFISANLAKVLALSGKKVVLLGADLRNPKLHEVFKLPNGKATAGLTNFITQKELKPSDITYRMGEKDPLDVIPSGVIPPNPAELLLSDRVREIFKHLRENYDYVIVDTAPVHLVTDTLLIGEMADMTLYVVRANFLDKRLLSTPETLYKENRLPNLAVLLNDTDYKKGYGYGYGYGYGNSK